MARRWNKKYPLVFYLGIFAIIFILPTPASSHCTLYANYWYRHLERWQLPTYVATQQNPSKGRNIRWQLRLGNFPDDLRPRVEDLTRQAISEWDGIQRQEHHFNGLDVRQDGAPQAGMPDIFFDKTGELFI